MSLIESLKDVILSGGEISEEQAYALCDEAAADREALYEAAKEITAKFGPRRFDSCSIINARSGKCPENCKWCAQSAHFKTKVENYPLISRQECMRQAEYNHRQGIRHISLVTSGRKMTGVELDHACSYFKDMAKWQDVGLCASMGLLNEEELQKLWDAGGRRYHCNLEAAPDFFDSLCTTHSIEDKFRTIEAAKKIGFEICSGGIIGMGESRRQRVGLGIALRRVNPMSIPVNILCPIPGTPLEKAQPLSEEEILDTICLYRFIHPRAIIRFAGGRTKLSRDAQLRAMAIGINGGIVGDLLTTVGSTVEEDKKLIEDANMEF